MYSYIGIVLFCYFASTRSASEPPTHCWSDVCLDGEDFCVQKCPTNFSQCSASARVDHFGTINVYGLHCVNRPGAEECQSEQCVFEVHGETHTCCCNGPLCNTIPGLTPGSSPAVSVPTVMPTGSLPDVPSSHVICEFFNCSAHSNQTCFHGYVSCSEYPEASLDADHHYCVASYTKDDTTELYELSYKGCHFTHPQLATHCTPGYCHVDYISGDSDLQCCCEGDLCNVNVTFSDPLKFEGFIDPCAQAECDSCLLTQSGEAVCFCTKGYALDGQNSCVDIDECDLDIHSCVSPAECVNTNGSYMCQCPVGYKLVNEYECVDTGLTCEYMECVDECTEPEPMYCDESQDNRIQHCQVTFTRLNNSLLPRLASCLHVGDETCTEDVCIPRPTDKDPTVYFCCCRGDYCNTNIVNPLLETTPTTLSPSKVLEVSATHNLSEIGPTHSPVRPNHPQHGTDPADPTDVITLVAVSSLALLVFAFLVFIVAPCMFFQWRKWSRGPYLYPTGPPEIGDDDSSLSQPFGLHIQMIENIGRGQFASVWKATMGLGDNTEIVAVKVFSNYPRHKENFEQELSIYLTPQLQHDNILRYINNDKRSTELRLVLDYHNNGSLYDLLKRQHITLHQFLKLAQGASAGLAHLHSETVHNGKCVKPPIAHRDLKSKNVLIRSDFTACISDLGLAVKLDSTGSIENHGQVGTARYMSPEVLEGAIYFQREAYQRIDIYALALILWEMASRTEISGVQVERYRPPFDEWSVSKNPTVEEMRNIVVRERQRPRIPKGFLINSELDEIVDTITEAWDEDAEGRLSASCIEERFCMLKNKLGRVEPSKLSLELSPGSPTSSGGSSTMPVKEVECVPHGACEAHCTQQPSNWRIEIGTLASSPQAHRYSVEQISRQTEHHHQLSETTV